MRGCQNTKSFCDRRIKYFNMHPQKYMVISACCILKFSFSDALNIIIGQVHFAARAFLKCPYPCSIQTTVGELAWPFFQRWSRTPYLEQNNSKELLSMNIYIYICTNTTELRMFLILNFLCIIPVWLTWMRHVSFDYRLTSCRPLHVSSSLKNTVISQVTCLSSCLA